MSHIIPPSPAATIQICGRERGWDMRPHSLIEELKPTLTKIADEDTHATIGAQDNIAFMDLTIDGVPYRVTVETRTTA